MVMNAVADAFKEFAKGAVETATAGIVVAKSTAKLSSTLLDANTEALNAAIKALIASGNLTDSSVKLISEFLNTAGTPAAEATAEVLKVAKTIAEITRSAINDAKAITSESLATMAIVTELFKKTLELLGKKAMLPLFEKTSEIIGHSTSMIGNTSKLISKYFNTLLEIIALPVDAIEQFLLRRKLANKKALEDASKISDSTKREEATRKLDTEDNIINETKNLGDIIEEVQKEINDDVKEQQINPVASKNPENVIDVLTKKQLEVAEDVANEANNVANEANNVDNEANNVADQANNVADQANPFPKNYETLFGNNKINYRDLVGEPNSHLEDDIRQSTLAYAGGSRKSKKYLKSKSHKSKKHRKSQKRRKSKTRKQK